MSDIVSSDKLRKATAIAHPNIALVKYWGKRDEKLILPQNGSISMTLDKFSTKTTVEFLEGLEKDFIMLNSDVVLEGGVEYEKIVRFLDIVRLRAGVVLKAKVVSENDFPTAAGLASSASGFAALAVACSTAVGLDLDKKELSILARQGSGSASRSVYGGFVEWYRGEKEDGTDSYAEQLIDESGWGSFRMIAVEVVGEEKKVKSRAGMKQTVQTSPYYQSWLDTVDKDLEQVRKGLSGGNFKLVCEVAEKNCLKMHSLMLTTKPSLVYWNSGTMNVIRKVISMRDEDKGTECYFTIDAGHHICVMCEGKDVSNVQKELENLEGVKGLTICSPGDDAKLVDEHLF